MNLHDAPFDIESLPRPRRPVSQGAVFHLVGDRHGTDGAVTICTPFHRRENSAFSAAIRWPDLGDPPSLGG